jgi:Ca2+-binding RTX toxin-like protein
MARTRPAPPTLLCAALVLVTVLVPSAAGAQPATCEGETPTIVGTDGADDLVGTDEEDVIDGLGGDDRIRGLGESDVICGGPGNDVLDADGRPPEWPVREPVGDLLVAGDGDDYLEGTTGTYMFGGAGDDTFLDGATVSYSRAPNGVVADLGTGLAFGEGSDTLVGVENLRGSAFDDRLSGDERRNDLLGGPGSDQLWGAGQVDELQGGDGNDLVAGEDGDDHFLYGGAGDDFVSGGDGDDRIEPEIFTLPSDHDVGDDYVDGGDGFDMLSFNIGITAPVRVDLSKNVATGQGTDEIWDFEIVEGTYGNDWMKGDERDNVFWGNPGSDELIGGEGDDRLDVSSFGRQADVGDVAHGGPGADRIYAKYCCGEQPLDGGPGRDTLTFSGGSYNPPPPMSIDLRTGSWELSRWSGSFESIENVEGTFGDDLIVGDDGRNVLDGSSGSDVLRAMGGDDVLVGGPDADELDGGPDADVCRDRKDTRRRCEGP